MIPKINNLLNADIQNISEPTRNYKMYIKDNTIIGFTDNLDAMTQVVYSILNTEKFQYPIYSQSYGLETIDLYGKPMDYVKAELTRRITEALLSDDRITAVNNIQFNSENKNKLKITFTVNTVFGKIEDKTGVEVFVQ